MSATAANDANHNGLADWWEAYYHLPAGLDAAAAAPRGDGLSYLQAFHQGLNPLDFFGGWLPTSRLWVGTGSAARRAPGCPCP